MCLKDSNQTMSWITLRNIYLFLYVLFIIYYDCKRNSFGGFFLQTIRSLMRFHRHDDNFVFNEINKLIN